MKKQLLLIFAALMSASFVVADNTMNVTSPDGNLILTVGLDNGIPNYSATYKGKQMLEKSALGLTANIGDFTKDLTFKEAKTNDIDETYSISRTKASSIHYAAKQINIEYTNGKRQLMTITFNVSNNSIAYRYSFPMEGETACMVVESEASAFKFPQQTTTFICPQARPMSGWKRSKPSYEEEYRPDAKMDVKSANGLGYTFPCLFHIGNDGWVLVSETGTTSQYCGCRLSDYDETKGYTVSFPDKGENNGFGSNTASFALPGSTPWRTMTIGDNLKPIVETTVQFDVVKPLYEPSQEYKPGRSTWSWIVWQDASMNMNDQKTFIDLAHDMGYEYILVDALWETQVGRDRMPELFNYAKSKNVGIFLWYNSNGAENDAPQDAKNRMSNSIARKAEMKWLKANGVKGIKVDFFGGDKQETMRLYEDILSDANEYGIQVIFHGCTVPRGWERMYPNYVASEAVLASENLIFSQHHDDFEAQNGCIHPFIRNAVGSMDWGGTILNKRMSKDNNRGQYRRTTDMYELATAIVNQSSVQNFGITPNNLTEQPAFEIEFMKQVPTTWDETRFIDGYPGKYVVIARRHGSDWYVAALNANKTPLKLNISLPMLSGKNVKYYVDQPLKEGETIPSAELKSMKVNGKGKVTITVQPQGGAILVNN